jgi:hypothetical protein
MELDPNDDDFVKIGRTWPFDGVCGKGISHWNFLGKL